jgi:dTDP-4-amino-4,6-dideoxygalactose transaminase
MPVHLFGQPAEMDKIMSLARRHNLKVIEDNAQGIGAKYDVKYAGTIGDIGTLSFFPSKNLGAMGDGGMCLTNCDDLAAKLRQLRVHGENPKYYHKWVGLNSRLDSLQAAVLKVKLKYLEGWSEGRRQNALLYQELLSDVKEIRLPFVHEKATTIYNQFTLICERRDELLAFLQKNEIGCAIYYPLSLHLQECFAYLGGKAGDCPVSEEMSRKVLSIPIYGELEREQIEYVAQKIREFYE